MCEGGRLNCWGSYLKYRSFVGGYFQNFMQDIEFLTVEQLQIFAICFHPVNSRLDDDQVIAWAWASIRCLSVNNTLKGKGQEFQSIFCYESHLVIKSYLRFSRYKICILRTQTQEVDWRWYKVSLLRRHLQLFLLAPPPPTWLFVRVDRSPIAINYNRWPWYDPHLLLLIPWVSGFRHFCKK